MLHFRYRQLIILMLSKYQMVLFYESLFLDRRLIRLYFFRLVIHRGVAQFGRALRSGRRGRKFESCRLDSEFKRV